MSELALYQIDAFADGLFGGNPAAVVPLSGAWLADELLQQIAAENNLSETAYFRPRQDGDFDLRWFTPKTEVPLCGHATLASAHIVLRRLEPQREQVTFHTRSGPLTVTRDGERLRMDFPARPATPVEDARDHDAVAAALGAKPEELHEAGCYLCIFASQSEVAALAPDFRALTALDPPYVSVSAPADAPDVDFVSRFFAPQAGIDEDPVTGSIHTTLVPYWSKRLARTELVARQISARGGTLWCAQRDDRVSIAGHTVEYLEGRITIPSP